MDLSNKKRNMILIVMLAGCFITALAQNLLASALPSIMKAFTVSATEVQSLTTVYIMVLGVVTSISAYLMKSFNIKNLFIWAMLIFLVGCIISIFAPNFVVLLLSRILQGFGAGILFPMIQVVTIKTFPVGQQGKAMGVVGLVYGFPPAIGPTLSGVLVDYFGWKSIFYFLIVFSSLVIIGAACILIDIGGEKTSGKMDFLSAVLCGVGFCGLMLVVTNQQSYGWMHYFTLVPLFFGVLCLCVFAIRQLKLPAPLLQLRIFQNTTFAVTTVITIIAYIGFMSGLIIVPIYIQSVRGFSALISGLVIMPGAIIVALMNPITGHILDKHGVRIVSTLGMILFGIGTGAFALFGDQTSLILVAIMYGVMMIGKSFLLMPLTTYGLSKLGEKNIPHGVAILNSLRQMVGALGSAILVAIMVAASRDSLIIDSYGVNVAFGIQTGMIIFCFICTLKFFKSDKMTR